MEPDASSQATGAAGTVSKQQQDSSPPQARTRGDPPSKDEIITIANNALAVLKETLEKHIGTHDANEEERNALVKTLNLTCDVHLGNMNISELPEELTEVISHGITRVTFAHNRLNSISNLSKGFTTCASLKYLVLRSNELKEFPDACFSLPNLELLDLKKNYIEYLPEDLDRMPKLRVLSVVRNKIQRLPVCIGNMKALHQLATRRNPISFPPKEVWAIENIPDGDIKGEERGNDKEKQRDLTETAKIKKFLQDYQLSQTRERSKEPESELSESNVETPRPTRRKTSGRFPIKPSISGIDYGSESIPASPMLPRAPPLPSKSYMRVEKANHPSGSTSPNPPPTAVLPSSQTAAIASNASQPTATGNPSQLVSVVNHGQPTSTASLNQSLTAGSLGQSASAVNLGQSFGAASLRPGVAPLVTSNERNRSNSESQMPTSVREKRMGIVSRKTTESEKLAIQKGNRLSHLRGLSHGSALQNSSVPPVSGSSSPTSPTDVESQKAIQSRRLSSLPEGRRKSRVDDPVIELVKGLLYSLKQVHEPLKELVKVPRAANLLNVYLERTFYTSLTFEKELAENVAKLERREEDYREDEWEKSLASLTESGRVCTKTTDDLVMAVKHRDNLRAIVEHNSPQKVRTFMHMLYASLVEIRNSCLKPGDVDLRPTTGDDYREFHLDRPTSPSLKRPMTSLRVGAQQRSASNVGQASGTHGAQNYTRKTSASDQHAPYGMVTPALSRSNTFGSHEDDEGQMFEKIWHYANTASDLAAEVMPACIVMLSNAREVAANHRMPDLELNYFDLLLDRCKRVRDGADALKRRWGAFSVKDPGLSTHPEFWSAVTILTMDYTIFAGHIKDGAKTIPSYPMEIRALLKPMHAVVKELSRTINNSPWNHMAATQNNPTKIPYQSVNYMSSLPQSHVNGSQNSSQQPAYQSKLQAQQPQLSLQTRGPVPPTNVSDPASAVSGISSNGNGALSSGHVTPLPATPMSAALGPAALATMPMIPDLPASTQPLGSGVLGNTVNGSNGIQQAPAGTLERAKSLSQRALSRE